MTNLEKVLAEQWTLRAVDAEPEEHYLQWARIARDSDPEHPPTLLMSTSDGDATCAQVAILGKRALAWLLARSICEQCVRGCDCATHHRERETIIEEAGKIG